MFEPLDDLTAIALQKEIPQVIKNFEPRASVTKTIVIVDYDNNGFSIDLEFFVINLTNPITITFFLERIR